MPQAASQSQAGGSQKSTQMMKITEPDEKPVPEVSSEVAPQEPAVVNPASAEQLQNVQPETIKRESQEIPIQ